MKSFLAFFFVLFIVSLKINGQICTPKGTSLDYTNTPPGSQYDSTAWESNAAAWIAANAQGKYVKKIGNATGSYNCHAYAWHVSQNGNKDWLNAFLTNDLINFYYDNYYSTPPQPNNIKKFWDDGSYSQVASETQAEKIWYGSCWAWFPSATPPQWINLCDHSAVKTSTNGIYISKWGKWPLYEHDYDACPYSSSNRTYYKLNFPVSGDFLLCTSDKTFTLNNNPSGTITWSTNPSNYTTPNSGNGTQAAIHASSGIISGYYRIIFNITPCGNASYQITSDPFWVGKFESTFVTGQAAVCPGELYTYTALIPGGHNPSYTYSWTYPWNWSVDWQYQNFIRLYTPMYDPAYGTVRVSTTNECGASGYSGVTVYPDYYGCGDFFSIYPNPASNEITISIDNSFEGITKKIKPINEEPSLLVRVFNNYGVLVISTKNNGLSFNIPTVSLQDGNYIIELTYGEKVFRRHLIVKH